MSIFSPEELKKLNVFVAQKKFKSLKYLFEETKDKMINEFLQHPITFEINAGPYASNSSGTLNVPDGNLFTFIGFEEEQNPIEPILELLNSITIANDKDLIIFKFPSLDDFWEATPMPWQEGRSWAKGIESGISGLNYYLFNRDKMFVESRSGPAIQVQNKLKTGVRYRPTQYITTFLKKYRTIFTKLGKKNNAVLEIV